MNGKFIGSYNVPDKEIDKKGNVIADFMAHAFTSPPTPEEAAADSVRSIIIIANKELAKNSS